MNRTIITDAIDMRFLNIPELCELCSIIIQKSQDQFIVIMKTWEVEEPITKLLTNNLCRLEMRLQQLSERYCITLKTGKPKFNLIEVDTKIHDKFMEHGKPYGDHVLGPKLKHYKYLFTSDKFITVPAINLFNFTVIFVRNCLLCIEGKDSEMSITLMMARMNLETIRQEWQDIFGYEYRNGISDEYKKVHKLTLEINYDILRTKGTVSQKLLIRDGQNGNGPSSSALLK